MRSSTNPINTAGNSVSMEQTKRFTTPERPAAGRSVNRTGGVSSSIRGRLMVVGALLAPAAMAYGCTLNTNGTGLFADGAGGDAGYNPDVVDLPDSSVFPDGSEKDVGPDVEKVKDTGSEDAVVDVDGDSPDTGLSDADSGPDVDADADADATLDAEGMDAKPDVVDSGDSGAGGSDSGSDSGAGGGDSGTGGSDAGPDSGSVDSGTDAGNPGCGSVGSVVFDQVKMSCFRVILDRAGAIVPSPASSDDTPSCEVGGCANTPINGDFDILWVPETGNTGYFTSVKTPVAYNAHCLPAYTLASPPDNVQLKSTLSLPNGWITPDVATAGTSYTVSAAPCAGQSVVYAMQYGP